MTGGDKDEYNRRRSKRTLSKVRDIIKKIDDADAEHRKAQKELEKAKWTLEKAERIDKAVERAKRRVEESGYKEGDRDKIEKELKDVEKKRDDMTYKSSADTDYREKHADELKELNGKYNQLHFLLGEYDNAFDDEAYSDVFPDRKRITGKEARANLEKAEKAEKETSKNHEQARSALGEIRRKAESVRLYSEEERKKTIDDISGSNSLKDISESGREKVRQELEKMSDAQLSVLKKTIGGAHIGKAWGTSASGAESWYMFGTGSIAIGEDDMDSPQVIFHEYGHYLDDAKVSGCNLGEGDFGYDGSEFKRGLSDVVRARKILHGNNAREDLQRLVGDKMKIANSDSGDIIWVENENGQVNEWTDYDKLQKVINDKFSSFIYSDKEFEDYCHSIGMPMESDSPKFSDYFETYTTPKRHLVRTREKFKGAEDKWRVALKEYSDKKDKAWEEHSDEYMEKLEEHNKGVEKRQKMIAPVSDIMCGIFRGKGPWIYGGHSEDYYQYMEKPAHEAVANFHQMKSMGWNDAIGLLRSLVPSVADGLEDVYNEWLWRNINEA